jgi:hypothetical protein
MVVGACGVSILTEEYDKVLKKYGMRGNIWCNTRGDGMPVSSTQEIGWSIDGARISAMVDQVGVPFYGEDGGEGEEW